MRIIYNGELKVFGIDLHKKQNMTTELDIIGWLPYDSGTNYRCICLKKMCALKYKKNFLKKCFENVFVKIKKYYQIKKNPDTEIIAKTNVSS